MFLLLTNSPVPPKSSSMNPFLKRTVGRNTSKCPQFPFFITESIKFSAREEILNIGLNDFIRELTGTMSSCMKKLSHQGHEMFAMFHFSICEDKKSASL